jgi:hypothetical protein
VTRLNKCGSCRCDFTSLELFDAHRVGKHRYTYADGPATIGHCQTEPPATGVGSVGIVLGDRADDDEGAATHQLAVTGGRPRAEAWPDEPGVATGAEAGRRGQPRARGPGRQDLVSLVPELDVVVAGARYGTPAQNR